MNTLSLKGKWIFRLLPVCFVCVIACVAISVAVDHFSKPYRADRFIAHWAGIFASNRSLGALRNLPQKERPDLITIREFENGQWFAARTEYACGDGAGFDATVFADSEGSIHFQKGYHFCGIEALGNELGFSGVTNLAGLYPKLKGFGLKLWPTEEETENALSNPDTSRKAYKEAIKTWEERDLSPPPYEDWKLFQEQDKLRTLYVQLLHINPDNVRAEMERYQNQFFTEWEVYKQQRNITNETSLASCEQENNAEIDFRKQFWSTHKIPPATEIVRSWEMWGEYEDAEKYFRENMKKEKVSPEDAFKALLLSNRHRKAISQLEQSLFPCKGEDKNSEKSTIESLRKTAKEVLDSFKPSADTPFSSTLATEAREEIDKSTKLETHKQFGSALQWASHSVETARSAKALHELETQKGRQ